MPTLSTLIALSQFVLTVAILLVAVSRKWQGLEDRVKQGARSNGQPSVGELARDVAALKSDRVLCKVCEATTTADKREHDELRSLIRAVHHRIDGMDRAS